MTSFITSLNMDKIADYFSKPENDLDGKPDFVSREELASAKGTMGTQVDDVIDGLLEGENYKTLAKSQIEGAFDPQHAFGTRVSLNDLRKPSLSLTQRLAKAQKA